MNTQSLAPRTRKTTVKTQSRSQAAKPKSVKPKASKPKVSQTKTAKSKTATAKAAEPTESFTPESDRSSVLDQLKDFASRALKGFSYPKEPAYKAEGGPFKVDFKYQTFEDESRHRKIPMAMYYPKGQAEPGSSPVVVMSHGLAGNAATYRYFGRHLASHGYTVLQPTHVGSDTKAMLTRTPILAFGQTELKDRVADVGYALDLVEQKKLPKELTDSADLKHVALAGHSFGALTAEAVAGVVARDNEGAEVPLIDERFDAFIAMSPYGDSMPSHLLGLDVNTYDRIDKPVLYLSGDKDTLFTLGKGAEAHSAPFQGTETDEKYHVVIGGTRHAEFAQVIGLIDRRTVEMTNSTSTAFLDAYLKDDAAAQEYLTDQLPAVARTRESWAFIGPTGENCDKLPVPSTKK